MKIEQTQDVEKIRGIAAKWSAECNGSVFGLTVDTDEALRDLAIWLDHAPGTLLLAYDGAELTGFFAVFAVKNFLGREMLALEKYWYCLPNKVRAGPALFEAAVLWSKQNGCSHLIVSASNLASDLHDKVCKFCERMGMQVFETAYAGKV